MLGDERAGRVEVVGGLQARDQRLGGTRTGVRHFVEEHTISLFTREQYETAFASAGLSVEYVAGLNAGRGLFVGTLLDTAQDQHRPSAH
ncbi:hypothetical protein ACWD4N_46740 [Streptomyces sp. NPDC002586]